MKRVIMAMLPDKTKECEKRSKLANGGPVSDMIIQYISGIYNYLFLP